MNTPAPGGYRIADEIESSATTRRAKPPWSPTGLFVLTVLFAPVGALMFGLNWGRLGFPEKRLPVFAAGLVPLVLIVGISLAAPALGLTLDRSTWRPVVSFISLGIAYWQLLGQRPHFEAHIGRGGEKASGCWLWVMGLLVLLFLVGGMVLRDAR